MANMDTYAAIADGHRRHILEELRRSESTVGSLAAGIAISRPAVSQHLKVLLDAGLVSVRASGTKRIYRLRKEGFLAMSLWLDQFWSPGDDFNLS